MTVGEAFIRAAMPPPPPNQSIFLVRVVGMVLYGPSGALLMRKYTRLHFLSSQVGSSWIWPHNNHEAFFNELYSSWSCIKHHVDDTITE